MRKTVQTLHATSRYHKELLMIIYHLIAAIAIFSLVYVLNNFTHAQNSNLTIINDESVQTSRSVGTSQQLTYEDLSSMSYKLVILQIKIGTSRGNLDLLKLNIESDILETINDIETLAKEDIIERLKNSPNKQTTFNNYLQKSDLAMSKGNFFIMILDQDISTRTAQMNACIEEKKVSDQEYFNGINFYDQQGMIAALKKSAIYNTCIAQARLEINAKTAVVSKLKVYYDVLKTKSDFLAQKQEIILNNVNILDANILQELNTINNTLNTYKF